jgi:hypothetical protein
MRLCSALLEVVGLDIVERVQEGGVAPGLQYHQFHQPSDYRELGRSGIVYQLTIRVYRHLEINQSHLGEI